ncbi:MAG: glycosyltransferase family 4 protein [Chloroflexota bacterium]|nr:MAG: glycosyltransferase family 4 protein [Chloroflexota bacterium]
MKVTLVRGRAIDPAVNKVAKTLSEHGYEVTLLVWDRQNTLSARGDEGYKICKFGFKAPHDRLTVILYLPIWWIYEFFFLLRNKCNVIHACDLDTLIPAIPAKLIKRVPLCYTIYDFYANNLPDGRFQAVRRLARSLVAGAEKFGIGFTEILFLVDETRYEEVRGARIDKLAYIYNSPPDYSDVSQTKKPKKASGELTVFYAGIINRPRGLHLMARAIQDLGGVRLILAGAVHDEAFLENSVLISGKIQYLGWLPSYEDVIKATLEADILFRLSDPEIPKTRYESPNKLFEAMMCGKPIIVSDASSMADIVRKENCGLVVPYGDIDAIKEAVLELRNNPELRQGLGQNGRKAYENHYSWQIMEQRLLDSYHQLSDEVSKKAKKRESRVS